MNEFILHRQLEQDSLFLADWPLCQLRLINNAHLPWFLLIPRRNGITEIFELEENDREQLWRESQMLSSALMSHFEGDKLNVAAIGNMVPQLHLHHVVRYKNDPCWPAPVWGNLSPKNYKDEELPSIHDWVSQLIHI